MRAGIVLSFALAFLALPVAAQTTVVVDEEVEVLIDAPPGVEPVEHRVVVGRDALPVHEIALEPSSVVPDELEAAAPREAARAVDDAFSSWDDAANRASQSPRTLPVVACEAWNLAAPECGTIRGSQLSQGVRYERHVFSYRTTILDARPYPGCHPFDDNEDFEPTRNAKRQARDKANKTPLAQPCTLVILPPSLCEGDPLRKEGDWTWHRDHHLQKAEEQGGYCVEVSIELWPLANLLSILERWDVALPPLPLRDDLARAAEQPFSARLPREHVPSRLVVARPHVDSVRVALEEVSVRAGTIAPDGDTLAPPHGALPSAAFAASKSFDDVAGSVDTRNLLAAAPVAQTAARAGPTAAEAAPGAQIARVPATAGAPPLAGALPLALLGLAVAVPAWLLYRRVHRDRALAHPVRAAVFEEIRRRPGVTPGEVAAVLGVHYTTGEHHVRILADLGLLEVKRAGRTLHCFENHGTHGRVDKAVRIAVRTPAVAALLAAVARRPGLCPAEAARAAGVARSTGKQHVDRLAAAGLLRVERVGARVALRVPAEVVDPLCSALGRTPSLPET
ncbi:MAG TPA: helix-turn-helix domain-containing protein [Candidatus Thermoplasmatota archaeon]|nr:helix-turn-helix domain-containing protein [Candidatus Thermoplasmatota archaeon]